MPRLVFLVISAAAGALAGEPPPISFREVGVEAGLDFVLEHHPTARKHLIETMPGGAAAFDYDGDGLVDLFFANGAEIPSLEKTAPKYWNRMYRNEGGLRFRDVTREVDVAGEGYSMGAAASDFDNDGHVDLFVAGVQRNLLYRNRGDGTFEEVSRAAGLSSDRWSVAGGWFDYDNDGYLDLFIVNYVEWTTAFDRFCGDRAAGLRVYCHPKYFEGVPNALYRNRGDGTFEDVSERTGLSAAIGKGMSVAFADYDEDGRLDVFVTNDAVPNFLFRNINGERFEEVALAAGVALTDSGRPVSSMGADFQDYDNDGRPDLVVTALSGETFPLFRNEGEGLFQDATAASGLAAATITRSGWGVGFHDFNNDGWKDLFSAGSHVNDEIEKFQAARYRQPNSVFLNLGDGRFRDVSAAAGEDFQARAAHRGLVVSDFDDDGDLDAVVTVLGERVKLFENRLSGEGINRLAVRLIGTGGARDAIGAEVRVGNQVRIMTTAVGYASSVHAPLHFGLGDEAGPVDVEVVWANGREQIVRDVEINREIVIREER